MLRSYIDNDHNLRFYVDGDLQDKEILFDMLYAEFYKPSDYDTPDSNNVDNIVFWSDEEHVGPLYGPIRLLSLVEKYIKCMRVEYVKEAIYERYIPEVDVAEVDDNILEGITLRDYQVISIGKSLSHKRGIIQVCTGGGKTEIALAIVVSLGGKSVICVPSTKLLYQTKERAINRGIEESNITLYGDGNVLNPEAEVMIATVQTLSRRLDDDDFIEWSKDLKLLIMDEAHHCSARTFFSVVDGLSPEYIIGVTAEPYYNDKTHKVQDLLVSGLLGSILYRVTVPMLVEKGYLSKPYLLTFESTWEHPNLYTSQVWSTIHKYGIINNPNRNKSIVDISESLLEVNKKPLILISQIKHGIFLSQMISSKGYKVAMLTGGSSVDVFMDGNIVEELVDKEGDIAKRFTDGDVDVLIGTSVLDEGVDIPAISAVILAGGGKSPIKVVQRLGRSLRPKKDDNTTIIVDFLDGFNVVTKSHSKKRRDIIRNLGVEEYYCNPSKPIKDLINEYVTYFKSRVTI